MGAVGDVVGLLQGVVIVAIVAPVGVVIWKRFVRVRLARGDDRTSHQDGCWGRSPMGPRRRGQAVGWIGPPTVAGATTAELPMTFPDTEPDTDDPTTRDGFAALGLRAETLAALDDLGYEEPTPIQREAIPLLIAGHDLLGQAATGTGKTAAFALPALEHVDPSAPAAPIALVLVPTRELAVQVSEAIFKYGRHVGVKVVPIYGGQPIFRQLQQLDRGVHVVVATPGRAIDHIGRGSLPLGAIRVVVLDEADEMLDMGFADDIESILEATPAERQTVLFSATLPARINTIAKRYQRDPIRIQIGKGDAKPTKALVRQSAYVVLRSHKPAALGRILDIESPGAALVFCRTRGEVDQLTETMNGRGYRAEALHGGMDQAQRERVIGRLRDGTAELLVATDVAARGLDIDTLTHVVNYDVPSAAENYVHRIGRVGRAGREGVAITLAEPREQRLLANIERLTKQRIGIESVPTVADLRARRVGQTIEAVRIALGADDLNDYNEVLHALSGEHNIRTIALAAIKLAHEAEGASTDDVEIPDASKRFERTDQRPPRRDRGERSDHGERRPGPARTEHRRQQVRGLKGDERTRDDNEPTGYLFVGLGRKGGVRPGDLVGAIANESGIEGRRIGPIRIADNFSVVGVPERKVDDIVAAMRSTMIRGKKATVRRYTD
jgi:ATP-dependent RNA helicase DeaD